LVRVGQTKAKIDGLYTYPVHGSTDTRVYVMDTGIYRENVDFQGRAVFGADFTTNNPPKTDLQGHGTHCAGTVIGKDYGVTKDVTAVDVRVLGADGSGTYAGIIAGVDYVAEQGAGKRSVGSMSLGGGKSTAVNAAVNAAVGAGVTMVVAAGNEAMDACNVSPASATKAITVMCSDNTDSMCYFSNYGSCTNIIAPGMSITSAWIGSKYADNTISGTSMSAPHVAGVAAHILEMSSKVLTPDQVSAQLQSTASKGVITNLAGGSSSPNVLLQSVCMGEKKEIVV
jgi:subtilisin family serine protease